MQKYEDFISVNLVAYTQPNPDFNFSNKLEDAQDLIAYCARVSNPESQVNNESSERLINYLIKHKHWSPLEMVNVLLEINTTRDIGRQIIRHKSFTPQEFSQRYQSIDYDVDRGMSFVLREARRQDEKNRQNSIDDIPADIQKQWLLKQSQLIHEANLAYQWALSNGIAKECARVVLPEGNTTTRMYLNGTMRSWIHYIELRSANGTQLEHILIAKECAKIIAEIFPMIKKVINDD